MKKFSLLFLTLLLFSLINAQNVGIGTNSPAKKLEVKQGKILTSGVTSGGSDAGVQFHLDDGTDPAYFQFIPYSGGAEEGLILQRLTGTPGSETFAGNVLAINQSDGGILLGYDAGGADRCDPSAVVQILADNGDKGVLLPSVNLTSSTDITTIASPATGLLVYVPSASGDLSVGFHYFNGTAWQTLGGGSTAADWTTMTNIPVDIADGDDVDDADASTTNEIITAGTLNGANLEITEAGATTTVDLSSLKDKDWLKTDDSDATAIGDDIYTNGNVGIGTTTLSQELNVSGQTQLTDDSPATAANTATLNIETQTSNGIYWNGGFEQSIKQTDAATNSSSFMWFKSDQFPVGAIHNTDIWVAEGMYVLSVAINGGNNDAICVPVACSSNWTAGNGIHMSPMAMYTGTPGMVAVVNNRTFTLDFNPLGTDLLIDLSVSSSDGRLYVEKTGGAFAGDIKVSCQAITVPIRTGY